MSAISAIFVFTRNRPDSLKDTLSNLKSEKYHKFVVDDSSIALEASRVESLCGQYTDVTYLGIPSYYQFLEKHRIDSQKFQFLLRQLGDDEWNLGYARNFALLYAKSINLNAVLFSDDDIQFPDGNLITHLFESLRDYQFSGAHIKGLVDDSIMGHIATDLGVINERMLSGGFMAFNPNMVEHFFLNNYNEDWIWLFLQLRHKKYLQTGEVFQLLSDPLENYQEKIRFQEFGEIILDGVMDLYHTHSFDNLTSISFWERILAERQEYLIKLKLLSTTKSRSQYLNIIQRIEAIPEITTASELSLLFEKIAYNRNLFHSLYKSFT